MKKIDLHCHSTLSDGSHTVSDIVNMAAAQGITHMALTDHETFRGYDYFAYLCNQVGIVPIKGCELSCVDPDTGRFVHVLCYNPQNMEGLMQLTESTTARRRNAGFKMLKNVKALYPEVDEGRVIDHALESECIYKTHIMYELKRLGYTDKIMGDLFKELLSPRGSCFETIGYPNVYDVLPVAKASGGVVVLAHPSVYQSMDLARKLAENHMVDGIEVHHPRNREEDKAVLLELCQKYGLHVTGGTDYHGHNANDNPIGTGLAPEEILNVLLP